MRILQETLRPGSDRVNWWDMHDKRDISILYKTGTAYSLILSRTLFLFYQSGSELILNYLFICRMYMLLDGVKCLLAYDMLNLAGVLSGSLLGNTETGKP